MVESQVKTVVALDCDGVIDPVPAWWNQAQNFLKISLVPVKGVREGIAFLKDNAEVEGIYTTRKYWREAQTARVAKRFGLEKVVHTLDSMDKVAWLLLHTQTHVRPDGYYETDFEGNFRRNENVHTVLIDDKVNDVVAGVRELNKSWPRLRPLLQGFTFVGLNPKQSAQMNGEMYLNGPHVITMRRWADIQQVWGEVSRLGTSQRKAA